MVSASGEEVYDRQSIANVFANFYEQLYEDKCKTKHIGSNTEERIEDFSSAELGAALKQLKSGKAADANSICAEMLKLGGSKIEDHFNMLQRYHKTRWRYTERMAQNIDKDST